VGLGHGDTFEQIRVRGALRLQPRQERIFQPKVVFFWL